MASAITIKLTLGDLLVRLDRLSTNAPQAAARALNRAMDSGRTAVKRAVASDTGLKAGDVDDRLSVRLATAEHPVALLLADLRRLPLIAFGAHGPTPSRGKGRGVTARLPGGAGTYPHAFITDVRGPLPGGIVSSGHTGVFERKGRARLPIRQLYGPSIHRVAVKYADVGLTRAREQLIKNLQSELRYAIRSAAA